MVGILVWRKRNCRDTKLKPTADTIGLADGDPWWQYTEMGLTEITLPSILSTTVWICLDDATDAADACSFGFISWLILEQK